MVNARKPEDAPKMAVPPVLPEKPKRPPLTLSGILRFLLLLLLELWTAFFIFIVVFSAMYAHYIEGFPETAEPELAFALFCIITALPWLIAWAYRYNKDCSHLTPLHTHFARTFFYALLMYTMLFLGCLALAIMLGTFEPTGDNLSLLWETYGAFYVWGAVLWIVTIAVFIVRRICKK